MADLALRNINEQISTRKEDEEWEFNRPTATPREPFKEKVTL